MRLRVPSGLGILRLIFGNPSWATFGDPGVARRRSRETCAKRALAYAAGWDVEEFMRLRVRYVRGLAVSDGLGQMFEIYCDVRVLP